MSRSFVRRGATLLALASITGTLGCADPAAPRTEDTAPVHVWTSVIGTPVATLTIEVSGADFPIPLIFNLTRQSDGTASGTINLPVGIARTITVRAFDAEGSITHDGSRTVDVRPGTNPTVTISLIPRPGQLPISITVASYIITVSPSTSTVFEGATVQLSAAITTPQGVAVTGTIVWATSNAALATVNASGLVTGVREGSVTIMATFSGVGAASSVAVQAGDFDAVAAGGSQSCGVDRTGVGYCWGLNGSGQLGDGTQTNRSVPTVIFGSITWAVIATGYGHSCGIDITGNAHCWGANTFGKLGDGTSHIPDNFVTLRTTPTAVSTTLTFKSMSVGSDHTCAVGTDDKIYCWGRNDSGELGDGTNTHRSTPVAVNSTLTFSSVSAGVSYTCGVATGGALYCWGWNTTGQLGNGNSTNQNSPAAVTSALQFTQVTAGQSHSCALATNGKAYCWGQQGNGALGIGPICSPSCDNLFTPTAVVTTETFTAIRVGTNHSCGVATDGKVWCWGANLSGQIGDGTTIKRTVPTAVASSLPFGSISLGGGHSCALAVGGRAYCWGANGVGNLGDGTTTSRLTPVAVAKP